MKQQQKMQPAVLAIKTAKTKFGKSLESINTSITKLTAQEGGASPDEVSEVLTDQVMPALQQVTEVLAEVSEALPTSDGDGEGLAGLGGLGNDGNNDNGGRDDEDDDDRNPLIGSNRSAQDDDDDDKDDKILKLEEQMGSMLKENLTMKKANLTERWGSTFPPTMRKAQEEAFEKDSEDEDDIDKLEAKVATAEATVKAYQTAGLIKKQTPGYYMQHTAKDSSRLRTAKNGSGESPIPWSMR